MNKKIPEKIFEKISKKNAAILFTIFIAISSLAIFYETLKLKTIEWTLQHYCHNCVGTHFTFKDFSLQEGALVINQPQILLDPASSFTADQMKILYTVHPLNRKIEAKIIIESPNIHLTEIPQALKEWFLTEHSPSWINLQCQWVIKNGQFSAPLSSQKIASNLNSNSLAHQPTPLHFQFSSECKDRLAWDFSGEFHSQPHSQTHPEQLHHEQSHQDAFQISYTKHQGTALFEGAFYQVQGHNLFPFIQLLLPDTKNWLVEGSLDGQAKFELADSDPLSDPLKAQGDIKLQHLKIANPSMHLEGFIEDLLVQIEMTPNHLAQVNLLKNSAFHLSSDEGKKYQIDHLRGSAMLEDLRHLKFACQGILHYGESTAIVGFEGRTALFDTEQDEFKVSLNGSLKELAQEIPSVFRQGIATHFPYEQLSLQAIGHKNPEGIHFEGTVRLQDRDAFSIPFGLDLEWPSSEECGFSGIQENTRTSLASQAIGGAVITTSKPLSALKVFCFGDGFGAEGVVVRNGWFKIRDFPLEKFLSPFIFPDEEIVLKGKAHIDGFFDSETAVIRYDTKHLIAENEAFKIEIKGNESSQDAQSQDPQWGTHYFNFAQGTHFGFIPLSGGFFLDKKANFTFSNVQANINIQGKKAYIRDIETFSEGIYFAGAIDLDYSLFREKHLDLLIRAHAMNGKVSQIRQLLNSSGHHPFLEKFPFEGNVSLVKDGGIFHLEVDPQSSSEGYVLQAHVQGALSEGSMDCLRADVSIHDLCCNFEYDYTKNSLDFTDIQGSLLVGKPGYVDEYAIAGEKVRFSDYAHHQLEFDVWVGDKKRDILRIAGKTLPDYKGTGNIVFTFDHRMTHFGDMHPSKIELTLKNWEEVDSFELASNFRLNTLFKDLQRFSRTGLFFLSRSTLKELNEIKQAEGSIQLDLRYDGKGSQMTYSMIGDQLVFNQSKIKKFLLTGKKQENAWSIDQLLMDQLSLSADITKLQDRWQVNFLGFRYGNSLTMGLDGNFFPDENRLEARLNLIEVNLAHIQELDRLGPVAEQLNPKGLLKATGKLQADFFKGEGWWKVEADLQAAIKDVELQGIYLKNADQISFHFASDKGVSLQGLSTALRSQQRSPEEVPLTFDKVGYEFMNSEVSVEGLHFHVPVSQMPWFSHVLRKEFPSLFSESFLEGLAQLKRKDPLEGTLNLEMTPSFHALSLGLAKGSYFLGDTEYQLGDLILQMDAHELKVTTQYLFQNRYFWLLARSPAPEFHKGELLISTEPFDKQPFPGKDLHPLVVLWEKQPTGSYSIRQADGDLAGLQIHLRNSHQVLGNPHLFALEGEIAIDMKEAQQLLSEEMAFKVHTMNLGRGYALKGQWIVDRENPSLSFQGILEGKNFEAKGYQIGNLLANMTYQDGHLVLQNTHVDDPSGSLQIPQISIWRDPSDQWFFSVPEIQVREFRPDLLRSIQAVSKESNKPLMLQQMEVKDLSGNLFEESTWAGQGEFQFTTLVKKNSPHPIFAVPSEVMNRIGLDTGVLNPASGTVYYEIRGNKIYLTRLKDVYSENKLSRFYLPKNPDSSYVDFEGNLNLQFKMKQYNLLFKFAELFTLTVQGDLQRPVYSLQKQLNDKNVALEE